MAVQTFAAATNLFKRVYFPGIRDQLNNTTPGLGILRSTGRSAWSGSEVRLASRTGRNRSYRPTRTANESAAFPTTGRQTYDNFTVNCVILHGSGGVTAFGSAASQGPEAAWADMLKAEIQGHVADMRKDLEIDFYGTPLGVLGRLSADPGAGAVYTVEQDPQQLVHWRGNGNRYLSVGQLVDVVDEAGTTIHDTGLVISAVASADRTGFTCDDGGTAGNGTALAAVTTGDLVVRSGTLLDATGAGGEANFAFSGIEHLFDSGDVATSTMPAVANAFGFELDNIQGVDRGATAGDYTRAPVRDFNGAALTRASINQMVRLMWEQSGVYPDVLLCHGSIQLAIQDLMVGDQWYQPQEFPGGFKAKALVWNAGDGDIPIIPTRECPYDRLYGLSLDCIENFVLQDFELIETDGSILRQDSGGGDVWNYNWRKFCNIGSRQPNGAFKAVRISADEAYGAGVARHYDF